jgi:macrolide phosphotransferase
LKQELLAEAGKHGLDLNLQSVEINESGMDFRVAFARDEMNRRWGLDQPRRSDVWERAVNEQKVLAVLRGHLPVAVPEWRVFDPGLITYPRLGSLSLRSIPQGAVMSGRACTSTLPNNELPNRLWSPSSR